MSKNQERGTQKKAAEAKSARSLAEWISFGVSLAIVLGALTIVVLEYVGPRNPARLEVHADGSQAYRVGENYHLPVMVVNKGGEAVENASVRISLRAGQMAVETTDLQFRFIGTGGQARAVAVFSRDPATHAIETRVTGYLVP